MGALGRGIVRNSDILERLGAPCDAGCLVILVNMAWINNNIISLITDFDTGP